MYCNYLLYIFLYSIYYYSYIYNKYTSNVLYLEKHYWHINFHRRNLELLQPLKSSISKIVLVLAILSCLRICTCN